MVITAYWWASWVQGAGTYYDAICPQYPDVSCTDRTEEGMRAGLVAAFNAAHPEVGILTVEDFEFGTAPPNEA